MTESQRMTFVQQRLINAMGMNQQYVYKTDMGREANEINEDMMREMITSSQAVGQNPLANVLGGPFDQ